jgi:hypothetical protein
MSSHRSRARPGRPSCPASPRRLDALGPLLGRLDVAVHHSRGRQHPETVCLAHDVEPSSDSGRSARPHGPNHLSPREGDERASSLPPRASWNQGAGGDARTRVRLRNVRFCPRPEDRTRRCCGRRTRCRCHRWRTPSSSRRTVLVLAFVLVHRRDELVVQHRLAGTAFDARTTTWWPSTSSPRSTSTSRPSVAVSPHTHGAQVGEVGIHGGPGGIGIWGMPAAWLASDLVETTFPNHPTVAMTIKEAT